MPEAKVDPALDERFIPAVDLIRRTGASAFAIRYCEEEEPVVWMAVATYQRGGREVHQVGAAFEPVGAVFSLCDALMDGGQCAHCKRPSGFTPDFDPMPADQFICWYQWDPELKTFRRGCEVEFPKGTK